MKPQKVVIKKYENRRLYDTTRSQYVNLDEVAQLVRDGSELQVLDAATGEDITRLILAQIIVEHAKSPNSVFPLDALRQMVVASGRATQESALKYVKAAFEMYQTALQAMAPGLNPFDFMSRPVQPHPFSVEGAPDSESGSTEAASHSPAVSEGSEVAELRRRLEELEALVSKSKARSKPRKSPPARRRKQ